MLIAMTPTTVSMDIALLPRFGGRKYEAIGMERFDLGQTAKSLADPQA